MNDFTILHLSDLHINQIGERLSLLMENLLIDIKNEMKFVDDIIIVITGDLVHKGNYEYKDSVIYFFTKLKECLGEKIIDIYNNKKNRKGRQEDIVKAGYDIVNTAKFLEEFYLESEEKARFYRR